MSKKLTTETFKQRAQQIHNNYYIYDKSRYIDSLNKIIITCPKHGDFTQLPHNHLVGKGCKICGRHKTSIKQKYTQDEIINLFKIKHNNFYLYKKVNYHNIHTKIIITCKKHGDFQQLPIHHLQGRGCNKCSILKRKFRKPPLEKSLLYNFPDICKEWSIKNRLTPNDYYAKSGKKVWWKCLKCNKIWKTKIVKRTKQFTGCPSCKSSCGERKIKHYLYQYDIYYIPQYRFNNCKNIKPLPFDFALIKNNKIIGLIEYNGQQHYFPFGKIDQNRVNECKKRDKIKSNFCTINNIPLLIIPYFKFQSIENEINQFFNTLNISKNEIYS